MSTSTYVCSSGEDNPQCPYTCANLEECTACNCAVIDTQGGPWGEAMDVIFCLSPILFLLGVTLKKHPLPTTQSLPGAALMMFLIRLMYLGSDPLLVCAAIISGIHEALSPLSIMFGAILLFETMEATLCMPYMMREMKAMTNGHPVAELMLTFGFAYMLEGASGFGTPVALGAPMLVSLGYDKMQAVVTLLLMNTFATVWGAAGTPIWFGFGNHDLTEEQFIQISYKAGTALLIASFLLLPTMVLPLCCKVQVLRENALFLTLSLSSVMLPAFGISFVSYEFPALIGGMVGCGLTAVLIQFRVGLKDYKPSEDGNDHLNIETTSLNHSIISQYREDRAEKRSKSSGSEGIRGEIIASSSLKHLPDGLVATVPKPYANQQSSISEISVSPTVENENLVPTGDGLGSDDEEANCEDADGNVDAHALIEKYLGPRKTMAEGYMWDLMARTFPLWGTVLLLVLTRIPQIGLRDLLTRREPSFPIYFGTYGTFRMSASLVLQLQDILTYPNINWRYELLFVPFIMPFSIVAVLTMWLFKKDMQSKPQAIFGTVASRLKNPAVALMGALVLVQLMIRGGAATPAKLIGTTLSEAFGGGWIAIVAFIGALGSFFSGSTTISNLTFGGIQLIAAESIGTSSTAMLALQAAGGSAGNGICLNNIISACTVVGLHVGEGQIIARTGLPVFTFCIIATLVVLALFFRF